MSLPSRGEKVQAAPLGAGGDQRFVRAEGHGWIGPLARASCSRRSLSGLARQDPARERPGDHEISPGRKARDAHSPSTFGRRLVDPSGPLGEVVRPPRGDGVVTPGQPEGLPVGREGRGDGESDFQGRRSGLALAEVEQPDVREQAQADPGIAGLASRAINASPRMPGLSIGSDRIGRIQGPPTIPAPPTWPGIDPPPIAGSRAPGDRLGVGPEEGELGHLVGPDRPGSHSPSVPSTS